MFSVLQKGHSGMTASKLQGLSQAVPATKIAGAPPVSMKWT
jgi:hypothetical protein